MSEKDQRAEQSAGKASPPASAQDYTLHPCESQTQHSHAHCHMIQKRVTCFRFSNIHTHTDAYTHILICVLLISSTSPPCRCLTRLAFTSRKFDLNRLSSRRRGRRHRGCFHWSIHRLRSHSLRQSKATYSTVYQQLCYDRCVYLY